MRSGYIMLPRVTGTFRDPGFASGYWSSLASSTFYDGSILPSVYYASFWGNYIRPSYGPENRWHGFPLRRLRRLKILINSKMIEFIEVKVLRTLSFGKSSILVLGSGEGSYFVAHLVQL